ncbi:HutD/Ves family protein [Pseudogemmobacter sonorensis]|uniref:HutD/Ves family protein n=1 Tax=Pseudogemmobacter sonorensis TaxID=2989681 RepID=UPI0036AB5746
MTGVYPVRGRVFRPWKNGGGETAEIAVSPAGTGFDGFDWRVSTAWVASDGPFSSFPGIDRVLTVIEGGPMVLEIDASRITLDAGSPPLAFAGEAPVMALLTGPPLLDFNVMCRRPMRARVEKGPLRPDHAARLIGAEVIAAGFG